MKRLNIIGDIHGRKSWIDLLRSDSTNVIVGDYFSPYEYIPYSECAQNFNEIVQEKLNGKYDIEMLIGNHDLDHWYSFEYGCSRHDSINEGKIRTLFMNNKDNLHAAYCCGDVLVTHAGVSAPWVARYTYLKNEEDVNKNFSFGWDWRDIQLDVEPGMKSIADAITKFNETSKRKLYETISNGAMMFWNNYHWIYNNGEWKTMEFTPKSLCDFINNLWETLPIAFSFGMNATRGDYYGETITQGPMWIRYQGLDTTNVFRGNADYLQVYGHTQSNDIQKYSDNTRIGEKWDINNTGKMVMVDCLGTRKKSLLVDLNDNGKVINVGYYEV